MGTTTGTRHDTNSETEPLLHGNNSSPPSRSDSNGDRQPSTTVDHGHDSSPRAQVSRARGIAICMSMWILIFIITSNFSALTTIQSPIAIDLDASTEVSWFASSYLIAITSITPIAGRLSIVFTPRAYLLASICVQGSGLLITSQASSLGQFLGGRVVSGIGSAAITPVAFILVTELVSQRRRGLFFGCVNTAYTTGISCGAVIAGVLEPVIGWRAVFWVQVPFSLLAAVAAFFAIPDLDVIKGRDGKGGHGHQGGSDSLVDKLAQIDYLGVITLISGVVLLLYSLSEPKIHPTLIVLSFVCLLLFLLVEAKWAQNPIIPVSVLKSRGNMLTSFATLGIMSARWTLLFYTPTYVLTLRGWPQTHAGLTLIPTNFGFGLGGLCVGWLHIRRTGSFYLSVLACFALFVLSMLTVSWISTPHSNIYLYLLIVFLNGFIAGALLNYSLAHVLHLTRRDSHVIVIPLNAMFRSLSGSFGAAIGGGLFLRTLQRVLKSEFKQRGVTGEKELIRQLLGRPGLVQKLEGVEREVALIGYEKALRGVYLAGSMLTLFVLFLQAGTGWKAPTQDKEEGEGDEIVRQDGVVPTTREEGLSPVVSHE